MTVNPDTEITLCHGNQRAVVSALGGSLRQYYTISDGGSVADIVWGYSGAPNKVGGQGDVLIPFPGRINRGRYDFNGKTYQMEINDKKGSNAIHGFVRDASWNVEREGEAAVLLKTHLYQDEGEALGYPFSLSVSLEYRLDDSGLACEFRARNIGEEEAPFGAGFHPYFVAGTESVDDSLALIPANKRLEFNDALIPTGKELPVEGTPLDFRDFRPVGDTVIDNCFLDLIRDSDGKARSYLKNPQTGRQVTVWQDEAFPFIVAFTGDTLPDGNKRNALAIEPMTCGSDAFNHPEWGLKVLKPGETFGGSWGVLGEGAEVS